MPWPESAPERRLAPSWRTWGVLLLLAVLALAVRSGGLGRPFLGVFSTKAAIHGMIARNWSARRTPWYLPTVDVLVRGERGLHLLEYPVPTALVALGHRLLGGPLELWGRGSCLLWSLVGLVFLFLAVRRRWGERAALGAAWAWALAPAGIIYGQHFLVEVPAVAWLLGAWWLFPRAVAPGAWLARGALWLLLAAALLTRPMLVVLLPWLVADAWAFSRAEAADGLRRLRAVALAGAALVPLAAWVAFVFHAAGPDGPLAHRVYYSLLQSGQVQQKAWRLLASADWYSQVGRELVLRGVGPLGFGLALWGLWQRRDRRVLWLLGGLSLGLVLLLPGKFYRMNYYYVLLLPVLCVGCGLGIDALLRGGRKPAAAWLILAGAFWLAGSLRLSWPGAYGTPAEDGLVLQAAATVQALTGPEERIVTLHGGGVALLYYCNRPGWAWTDNPRRLPRRLQQARAQGAQYVLWLGQQVPAALEESGLQIVRLWPGEQDRRERASQEKGSTGLLARWPDAPHGATTPLWKNIPRQRVRTKTSRGVRLIRMGTAGWKKPE